MFNFPPYLTLYKSAAWIHSMEIDQEQNRLFNSRNDGKGLSILDLETKNHFSISLTNSTEKFPPGNLIFNIVYNNQTQEIYAVTKDGLVIVNTTSWYYQRYFLAENYHPLYDSENTTRDIVFDKTTNRLFLGSDTEGIRIFSLDNRTFTHWSLMPSELQKGHAYGLSFNSQTNEIYYYNYDDVYSYNLTDNSVFKIRNFETLTSLHLNLITQQLFIAGNGVHIMNCSNYDIIEEYLVTPSEPYNIVEELIFDPSLGGMLFLSQQHNGLIVINTTSDKQYTIRREDGLMMNDIASLLLYSNNSKSILSIGTPGAISFFSIINEKISYTQKFDFQLPTVFTRSLWVNENNSQILLGVNEFLCIYDTNVKRINSYYDYVHGFNEGFWIKDVVIDEQTNLWYVASEKLFVFDPIQEIVVRNYSTINGLLDNTIKSLCLDKNARKLYIGTEKGLNILDLETDIIEKTFTFDAYCYDLLLDDASNRLFIASDEVYILNLNTLVITSLTIAGQTFSGDELAFYPEQKILFIGGINGLYVLDLKSNVLRTHFTYHNAPLVDNWIDGIFFDINTKMLFVANLGVQIYDFAHDFWLTLNDALLVEEELYHEYVEDLCFYKNHLYIALPYCGFTVLALEDSDFDGLFDCTEDWLFGTDKNEFDTDQDGFSDGEELWSGTDPLDPKSFPIELITYWRITLIGIIPGIGSMITIGIVITRFIHKKKSKKKTL
ncbi:MAG: hypothetical protein ACTSO7_16950 [Candidatus Heimdallarchaeota archaeon]